SSLASSASARSLSSASGNMLGDSELMTAGRIEPAESSMRMRAACSPDHEHRTGGVLHDLVGRRAQQTPPDPGVATVADHQKLRPHLHRVVRKRLGGVARANLAVGNQPGGVHAAGRLSLNVLEELVRRALLVLDLVERRRVARELLDGDEEEFRLGQTRQVRGRFEGALRPRRTIEAYRNTTVHQLPPRRACADAGTGAGGSPAEDIDALLGWKNVCAMSVGTIALAMTTVTSTVYCV